jgi:hypothetical protein
MRLHRQLEKAEEKQPFFLSIAFPFGKPFCAGDAIVIRVGHQDIAFVAPVITI